MEREPLGELYPRVMSELIPHLQKMQDTNRRLRELLNETDAMQDPWHFAIASSAIETTAVTAWLVELIEGLARRALGNDLGLSEGGLGTGESV